MASDSENGYEVITLVGTGTAGFMDGDGKVAQFYSPAGVTYESGGILYVAESSGNRIRKIIIE